MITSPHNDRLKELRKLHDRKHRERTKLFSAEGEDMLADAVRWGAVPKSVFYDADALDPHAPVLVDLPAEVELVPVLGEALRASSSLGSGSRVIGVWEQRWNARPPGARPPERNRAGGAAVVVYLHEVADPRNVGSVLRSALALVKSAIVISPGTADPFSPKAVRASMGAIFGQPIVRAPFEELRGLAPGARLVALAPGSGRALREAALEPPVALCLGSERLGLPEEVVAGCDEACHVPLNPDGAESLNVAMVATICLYEATKYSSGS